jgi:tyrosyl-tRNA synthetase
LILGRPAGGRNGGRAKGIGWLPGGVSVAGLSSQSWAGVPGKDGASRGHPRPADDAPPSSPARRRTLALPPVTSPGSSPADDAARLERGAAESLPAGALAGKLVTARSEGRPLRAKLGIDPTAADIHLGHTVVLRKLREFQDLGHVVVLIVGDYTARVGDPSGRSALRPVLSAEEIERNAQTYQEQAFLVLDPSPERLEVRRNGEWLDMRMEELFRLARTTTVAQLLAREDFAARYQEREPISILELLYPLLQGYDSVAVRADVELGGTDQTFNLLLGREIQRAYGQPEQAILTMPILPGRDGRQKMSKSVGNHIGITEPPEEVYGKTMSVPDSVLDQYWELLLGVESPAHLEPRESKRALAHELVARFQGRDAAAAAEREFDRVFVERRPPEEVEDVSFDPGNGTVHLPALLADVFGVSRSEGRRLLAQGAVRLGDRPLTSDDQDLPADALDGQLLRVGKLRFRRLHRG